MDDDIEIEIEESGQEFAAAPEFGVGGTADASGDQLMEEGELSDHEDLRRTHLGGNFGRSRKNIQDRLGPRVNFAAVAGGDSNYDMSQKTLPDLVQQLGGSGVTHDPKFAQKKEARAKRFQLEGQLPEPSYNDVQLMYDSLEVPKDQRDPESTEKLHRFETIHITGFSTKVTTTDLGEYFKDFNPVSCEWCDGKSANIVWGLDASAAKAMCYLSRPIGQSEDNQMENEAPNGENKKDSLVQQFEKNIFNDAVDTKEFGIKDAPAGGPWRIGKPSDLENWKDTSIFMRLSRQNDVKPILQDNDLSKKNFELRREGGILSSSKKQKIREAMALDQQMHEEHERSKKYTPGATWKDLAEDWSNTKKPETDFQDDLRLLANQLRRGKGKNSPIGDGIPVSRSAPKDWDAPEPEEDNPEAYEVPHGIKRKRRLIAREDSVSPPPQTLKFGEENEDRWTKKSKIPRMSMYADEEEDKVSAKDRIFSSIKRRVANKPQIEVYEEDVEDEAFDEQVVEGEEQVDMRQRLNFKVQGKDDESPSAIDARSRLNERFKLSSSLKSRLGDKEEHVEEQYDSGDSLENDTGADLGDTTEKMVIQVTQSDEDESKKPSKSRSSHKDHHRRRKDDRNEAMEEDGEEETNNDVDHRKKSLPKDLRSKISSEVIKIKTEKGEEEKKAAARRKRENEADQERQAEAELREARRRQRSERRLDRDDQDDRRRRREQERRNNDSRVVNRPDNRELKTRRDSDRNRDRNRDRDRDQDQRHERDAKRKDADRKPKSDQRKKQIKIKKEKMSDDSTSDSDSSSSSSSDSSSSSSSDSSSSDSSSDSDSSSSSSGSDRNRKKKSGSSKNGSSRTKSSKDEHRKKSSNEKGSSRSDNKSQEGIRDKLQEYLAKAKERRKKGGK